MAVVAPRAHARARAWRCRACCLCLFLCLCLCVLRAAVRRAPRARGAGAGAMADAPRGRASLLARVCADASFAGAPRVERVSRDVVVVRVPGARHVSLDAPPIAVVGGEGRVCAGEVARFAAHVAAWREGFHARRAVRVVETCAGAAGGYAVAAAQAERLLVRASRFRKGWCRGAWGGGVGECRTGGEGGLVVYDAAAGGV